VGLGLSLLGEAKAGVASTFDTDTDGWTAIGDVVTNAVFSATGGIREGKFS